MQSQLPNVNLLLPPTVVWRHRRENLKKCTLRGLESRPDFQFFTYPTHELPLLKNYIVLGLDAPPLSQADAQQGLLLVDATWRYADKMVKKLKEQPALIWRSIPSDFQTAYPRRQDDCSDPERGLASIEALYIAYLLLGRDPTGILDNYHWKEQFLEKNNL